VRRNGTRIVIYAPDLSKEVIAQRLSKSACRTAPHGGAGPTGSGPIGLRVGFKLQFCHDCQPTKDKT
jgi:glycine cleavage system protein P-like pyridoxal-binding family